MEDCADEAVLPAQSALDKTISVADMKLLITAVITFNSKQIVSAFLKVEMLKKALVAAVTKDEGGEGDGDICMTSTLQSMFLRPNTPSGEPATGHFPVLPITISDRERRQSMTESQADISVVAVKPQPSGLVPDISQMPVNQVTNQTTKSNNLDKLLRKHLSFPTREPRKKLHSLCSKRVAETVRSNTVSLLPRHILPAIHDSVKPRKRKSTVPRYIPWSSAGKAVSHLPASNLELPTSEVSVNSGGEQPAVEAASSSLPLLENLLVSTSVQTPPPHSTGSELTVSAPSVASAPRVNNDVETVAGQSTHVSQSVSEADLFTSTPYNVDNSLVSSEPKDTEAGGGCGPFVSTSQHTFVPSDYPVSNNYLSESSLLSDSIDLSCIADQSLSCLTNDILPFPDLSAISPSTLAGLAGYSGSEATPPSAHMPGNKIRKKRKTPKNVGLKEENHNNSNLNDVAAANNEKSNMGSQRMRCRRCNERFTSKTDYQQHLKSQICSTSYTHTHTCQICGYCALTRQRLIVHIRTHSGERPHRCPFCSYAATQQAPLKRHIQNIHMKEGAISLKTLKPGDVPVST